MTYIPSEFSPETWMIQLFGSKTAASGGVVRRQRKDVERIVGWHRFEQEVRRRGFHCFENAGHVMVICNQDPVHVIC